MSERERTLQEHADRLAAALALVLNDAHPAYANTAGWRGGVGGQAVTFGCSLKDPPPEDAWMDAGLALLTEPLMDYMRARRMRAETLNAHKAVLIGELKALLAPPVPVGSPGKEGK